MRRRKREKKVPIPKLSPACAMNQHGACRGVVTKGQQSWICECLHHLEDEEAPKLPPSGSPYQGQSY